MGESNGVLDAVLGPGERLLWAGRPRQGLVFRAIDLFLIPASLAWTSVLLTSVVLASRDGEWPRELVPVMVIAAYLVFGRFIADSYYRSGLIYGITGRRAIISSSRLIKRLQSFDTAMLRGMRLVEGSDGRGTVHLTEDRGFSNKLRTSGFGGLHAALGQTPLFFQVQDAKRAYRLLCDAARANRDTTAQSSGGETSLR